MPRTMTQSDEFRARLESALQTSRAAAKPPEQRSADVVPPGAAPNNLGTGPIGAGAYVVRDGDCTSSIAHASGHLWETLWNDAENQALRETRQDPNILLPGDRMHVPPLRPKSEPGATRLRHRFVRRGERIMLRLRLLDGDQPRGNQPYTLRVDGEEHRGETDPEGNLAASVSASAKQAHLFVGPEGEEVAFTIHIGTVHPLSELSGVQRRLNNLGFGCGAPDGEFGPQTRAALMRFQERFLLPVTGDLDEPTRARLREAHGM